MAKEKIITQADIEKLAREIQNDKDLDDDLSWEDCLEMAKEELGAKANFKAYVQATPTKAKAERKPRKLNEDKLAIIRLLAKCLEDNGYAPTIRASGEKYVDFGDYTISLTLHREKK